MGSKLSDIGIQRQRKLNGSLFPIFERTRDCLPNAHANLKKMLSRIFARAYHGRGHL